MKGYLSGLLLPLVAASPVLIDSVHRESAPILSATNAKALPDSYIVVFKDDVSHKAASDHRQWVQDLHMQTEETKLELRKRSQFPILDTVFEGLKHTYHIPGSLLGYSGHFDQDVIEQIRRQPDVSCSPCCSAYCIIAYLSALPPHDIHVTLALTFLPIKTYKHPSNC